MTRPAIIYAGSFLAALLISALSIPLLRRICIKLQLVDDPGDRKIHSAAMPLAGGLAVFTGVMVGLAIGVITIPLLPTTLREQMQYGFEHRTAQLLVIVFGALAMLVLGLIDDRWEFRPATKFCVQFFIALAVAGAGIRITMFVPSVVFSYAVTVLWILTIVNAFNFMDNMNGLCGGLAALACLFFGVAAADRGEYLVAALGFLCGGAFCGFLPWNFPRAKVFLGDSGSHLAGFLVAVLAILPHYYSRKYPQVLAVLTPLLVLAVPLLDLATVVLIRWCAGKPFYIGDTNHLSHRLVRRGFSATGAVLLIWAASILCGSLSWLVLR